MRFLALQRNIINKFGKLYSANPNAAKVLDEYIRCKVMRRETQAQQIAERLSEENPALISLFTFYRFFLVIPRIKKSTIYCAVPKSPDLVTAIKLWGEENNYRILEEGRPKSVRDFLGFFFKKKVMIRRSYIFGKVFKRYLRFFLKKFDSDLFSESDLGLLDLYANKQKLWYKRFLVKNDVKLLILDNDQSAELQLLVSAAKSLNVRAIVFAHGYIQDPYFVSIFPFHADHLCVWSEGQKNLVLKAGGAEKEAVVNFGYPNYDPGKFKIGNEGLQRVLLVLEPLDPQNTLVFNVLNLAISKFQSMGFNICVRLHPKQKGNKEILSRFPCSIKDVSYASVESCLIESSLVVGGNSSLLFEAPVLGVPAIQLRELKEFYFENAVEVQVYSIDERFVNELIAKFQESYEDRGGSVYHRLCLLLNELMLVDSVNNCSANNSKCLGKAFPEKF